MSSLLPEMLAQFPDAGVEILADGHEGCNATARWVVFYSRKLSTLPSRCWLSDRPDRLWTADQSCTYGSGSQRNFSIGMGYYAVPIVLGVHIGFGDEGSKPTQWAYQKHYPLGSPDDSVAEEMPTSISADFKEALRCRWLECFKATLIMCRRALESSCADLGATGTRLIDKIDSLRESGKITDPLKEMAHQVRLEGNQGAHADLSDVDAERVDMAIAFAREFFHHVYVMPAKLKKVKEAASGTQH